MMNKSKVYQYLRNNGFTVAEIAEAISKLEGGKLVRVYSEPCDCGDHIRHWDGGNYHQEISLIPVGDVLVLEDSDTREFERMGEREDIYVLAPNGKVVNLWGWNSRYLDYQKACPLASFRPGEADLFDGTLGTLEDIPEDWYIKYEYTYTDAEEYVMPDMSDDEEFTPLTTLEMLRKGI